MSNRLSFAQDPEDNPLGSAAPGQWGFGPNSSKSPLQKFLAPNVADKFAARKADERKWAGTPNEDIRKCWNQSKGAIGEAVLRHVFESCGLATHKPTIMVEGVERATAHFDMTVQGLGRLDGKLATEGVNGKFLWSGMRTTDSDYFGVIGVQPESITGYLIPGAELNRLYSLKQRGSFVAGLGHTRRTGGFTLSIDPTNPPAWLERFGGADDVFAARIMRESRRRGPR